MPLAEAVSTFPFSLLWYIINFILETNKRNRLKRLFLLVTVACLLLLGACTDAPLYTADNVIAAARTFSPDCNITITPEGGGWGCPPDPLYEEAEPVFGVEYMEDKEWHVTKICLLNPEHDGSWYFHEDTAELVEAIEKPEVLEVSEELDELEELEKLEELIEKETATHNNN